MKLSYRNWIGLGLLVSSVALLFPGLSSDLLTLDISFSAMILGRIDVYHETRSIMGTIGDLFNNGNAFIGFLILFFSVIIPVLKAIGLFLVLFVPALPKRKKILSFISLISKWSMADVFVVGVFIAFLSLRSVENVNAEVHVGFYLFTAYCLLSILAGMFIKIEEAEIETG